MPESGHESDAESVLSHVSETSDEADDAAAPACASAGSDVHDASDEASAKLQDTQQYESFVPDTESDASAAAAETRAPGPRMQACTTAYVESDAAYNVRAPVIALEAAATTTEPPPTPFKKPTPPTPFKTPTPPTPFKTPTPPPAHPTENVQARAHFPRLRLASLVVSWTPETPRLPTQTLAWETAVEAGADELPESATAGVYTEQELFAAAAAFCAPEEPASSVESGMEVESFECKQLALRADTAPDNPVLATSADAVVQHKTSDDVVQLPWTAVEEPADAELLAISADAVVQHKTSDDVVQLPWTAVEELSLIHISEPTRPY